MSRLPNGSASASARTLRCAGWLALPWVERESEDARRGHQRHAYVRAVLEGADPAAALSLLDEPEDRRQCVLLDWERLGSDLATPIETEGAYAVDMRARTARYLGSNIGRRYIETARSLGAPLGKWEVPGSLDLCGVSSSNPRRVVVIDMKGPWSETQPAAINAQGLFFAAAKFLLADQTGEDLDEVEFRIAHLRTTGAVADRDRAVFTRLDVDSYLDEYEAALVRADEARALVQIGRAPDVAKGAWCDHCPATEACPSNHALARQMLPELAAVAGRIEAMTLAEVGAAYEKANEQIRPLLDQVLDSLKERVRKEKIAPFPDGVRCAKVSTSLRTDFSRDTAIALLRRLGATQSDIDSCFVTKEQTRVIVGNLSRAAAVALKKGRAA